MRNPYCNYKINTHKELTKNLELEKSCYYTQRKKVRKYRLVEHHIVTGADILVAVAFAGQDDTDGLRAVFAHGVDLAGAGVGAEDYAGGGGVEGIPHVAGGMAWGDVEEAEVVFVGFDFG